MAHGWMDYDTTRQVAPARRGATRRPRQAFSGSCCGGDAVVAVAAAAAAALACCSTRHRLGQAQKHVETRSRSNYLKRPVLSLFSLLLQAFGRFHKLEATVSSQRPLVSSLPMQ